jgi:RNA polymerase sigma-32 factor
VKIGTTQNQRKLFFNLRKQREALVAAGVDPTPERIAKALDVSPKEVMEMERRMSAPDVSLDAPLGTDDGEGSRTRLDLIEDDFADPEDNIDSTHFKSLLQDKLAHFGAGLEGRELEIFRDRLVNDEPVTLQDLGDRWKVSRERGAPDREAAGAAAARVLAGGARRCGSDRAGAGAGVRAGPEGRPRAPRSGQAAAPA